jgi:hypothetical protein
MGLIVLAPAPALGKPRPLPATLYVKLPLENRIRARAVAQAVQRSFGERTEVNLTPIRHLLEPVGQQLERLTRADTAAKQGRTQMKNLEVDLAVSSLEEAVELQQKVFHLLSTSTSGVKDHAALLADLAISLFLSGDEKAARDTLQNALVLHPRLEYDAKRFPPQMKRLFDEVRFLVDELGVGDVKVVTTPRLAEVRVNGAFVGYSPIRVKGLTAGHNLVTISKPGYRTRTLQARVEGGTIVRRHHRARGQGQARAGEGTTRAAAATRSFGGRARCTPRGVGPGHPLPEAEDPLPRRDRGAQRAVEGADLRL